MSHLRGPKGHGIHREGAKSGGIEAQQNVVAALLQQRRVDALVFQGDWVVGHGGFLEENPIYKWMIPRGSPILRSFPKYIYIYICVCVLRLSTPLPPQWVGSPGSTPFPSICNLSAAFLRSSIVFARSLQHFWLPASHLLGTCYLLDDLRSTHTPSKYLRATYSHIYMC